MMNNTLRITANSLVNPFATDPDELCGRGLVKHVNPNLAVGLRIPNQVVHLILVDDIELIDFNNLDPPNIEHGSYDNDNDR